MVVDMEWSDLPELVTQDHENCVQKLHYLKQARTQSKNQILSNHGKVLSLAVFFNPSSKEMGFYNPRSQLDSTDVTYCPHAAEKRGDR